MQHRLLGQLNGPRGSASCEINAPAPAGTGQEWAGPVRGALEVEKSGQVYTGHGWLDATVVVPCSRCTLPHQVPLHVEVDETVALEQIDDPASFLAEEEDMASCPPIPILSGDCLDLSELVRQMLILAVPPRSLCRPDCQGLCPHCGADRNRQSCSCADEHLDPRLEALRKLL